ncbi:hypothetical protein OHD27_00005, partial [Escherichia coli]|nr:hypothetical protein [Escherichia coli]
SPCPATEQRKVNCLNRRAEPFPGDLPDAVFIEATVDDGGKNRRFVVQITGYGRAQGNADC